MVLEKRSLLSRLVVPGILTGFLVGGVLSYFSRVPPLTAFLDRQRSVNIDGACYFSSAGVFGTQTNIVDLFIKQEENYSKRKNFYIDGCSIYGIPSHMVQGIVSRWEGENRVELLDENLNRVFGTSTVRFSFDALEKHVYVLYNPGARYIRVVENGIDRFRRNISIEHILEIKDY